ncbi:acyltransferase family protein [Magnetospirillum fulvum]|uniref:Peptidoglycan/LPS O-acetylase OafA/YrhL, contains acyltransferase and SGNH-hydrolase domains n=1 Tax=Magnetospirillum fulvum TaxID=1082 RepID=A0A1H6HMK2_MAGFU|nr:acyltransferase family protein [Magnetospirillum fulvum]SEH35445.1 Peptidoglycan/LPS O-acetylase OafA/YrhL, contains acyltransferase and SGNH-hydrolase domains [Magnetospirillum fulvum]
MTLVSLLPTLPTLAGLGSVALLIFLLAGGLLKACPRLSEAVLGSAAGRAGELDGLRGALSLLVVLHHSLIVQAYCATGRYEPPPGNFNNLAGEAAVALFFIITASLYWKRLLGGARFDWPRLLLGRLRRLGPMYAVAVAILVAIVMAETGFSLRVTPAELAAEIGQWLSFDFLSLPDINGRPETYFIEVVVWTLRYEWQFVLCLPLLALFARGRRPWLLYAAGVALAAFGSADTLLYAYFAAGLIAADLNARKVLPPRVWAGLGLVALGVLLACYHDIYGLPQVGLITLIFLGASSGCGPWAILRARPLRFLGLISYSIYLLHHMVLHLVAEQIFGADRFAALDGWAFQGAVLMVGTTAILLSILTYLTVERRWLHPAPARAA